MNPARMVDLVDGQEVAWEVWISADPEVPCVKVVVMREGDDKFAKLRETLSPGEARSLGRALIEMADVADRGREDAL